MYSECFICILHSNSEGREWFMQDSYRAYQLFSYFWCGLIALAVGSQAVAQRSMPIMNGLSLTSLTGLATIWIMACMYFNIIALAHTPRQLMLACVSCAHASFDPPASVLGRPYEGLFMMLALIVGEAMGQKLDGQSRRMFAQRFASSTRQPQLAGPEKSCGEAKSPLSDQRGGLPLLTSAKPPSLALVGVIWTAFEDAVLEHDFSIDRFSNAYPHVVACCLSLIVVSGVHSFAFPAARVGDLIAIGLSVLMLVYRTMLQFLVTDRRLAQRLFYSLLSVMVIISLLVIKALQVKRQIDPGGLSGTGALFAAGSWLLAAFYFTLTGVPCAQRHQSLDSGLFFCLLLPLLLDLFTPFSTATIFPRSGTCSSLTPSLSSASRPRGYSLSQRSSSARPFLAGRQRLFTANSGCRIGPRSRPPKSALCERWMMHKRRRRACSKRLPSMSFTSCAMT